MHSFQAASRSSRRRVLPRNKLYRIFRLMVLWMAKKKRPKNFLPTAKLYGGQHKGLMAPRLVLKITWHPWKYCHLCNLAWKSAVLKWALCVVPVWQMWSTPWARWPGITWARLRATTSLRATRTPSGWWRSTAWELWWVCGALPLTTAARSLVQLNKPPNKQINE